MDCVEVNLVNFISEECSFVPDDLRNKLKDSLEKIFGSIKCDYEQKISSLEKSIIQLQEENNGDRLIEADLKIENLSGDIKTLQASCERLENEKQEMQKQMEDAASKYESLGNMVRNYDLQINHWKEKCAIMSTDFEKLNCEYCHVLDKYIAVKGLEKDYNKRLAESQSNWDNLTKENRHLQSEIDLLTSELTSCKDDSRHEIEMLKTQLAVKTSEVNTNLQRINELLQKIEMSDQMVEKLSLKLKEERAENIKQVESLEREIREQARVADLYKQRIINEESKMGDVAEGHKELIELIKYGEKKLKSLESELWKSEYNCKKHEENVKKHEKEIERLNDELAKTRSENVTRAIDELYPMIGAGRQLLKNNISFTEMLRQYSKASDEIFALKEENMGLKHSIEMIEQEIEAKVPYLKMQKEEYSKALKIIDDQVRQVDEIKAALVAAETEKKYSDTERRMCEAVVMDLSKQVQYLTAQLASTRRGMFMNKTMTDSSQLDMVFGSVEELQAENVKLLRKLKVMSEKEAEFQEEILNVQHMNEKTLVKQQEKYRQLELAIDESKEINNNLRQQLKVYQNMYKNKLNDTENDMMFSIAESTTGVQTDMSVCDVENLFREKTQIELHIKDLQEKFDITDKERQELFKQLEDSRLDLTVARSANCMLRAELDHAKQTFTCLNDTKDVLKKQITVLENQCKDYTTTFMDQKNIIEGLEATVKFERDGKLEKTQCLLKCEREYNALKEKEKLLRIEYEEMKQCETSLSMINASIEVVKVMAEKKSTESQEQLGTDMSSAMEECSVLRNLLQVKHKELDKLYVEKHAAEKSELELKEKLSEQLEAARNEIESKCIEINSLKDSLNECVLQKSVLTEEKEKLLNEMNARDIELKEYMTQCEDYKLRLHNLTLELEKCKAGNETREEGLLKEINDLKEKLSKLEQQKEMETISLQMVEKENKLKSQEEKFESILELEKQMNVDKELSMHSKAMVELMQDVAVKSEEIVKLKGEIEKAYADLAELENDYKLKERDFKQKEKDLESECSHLRQQVSSLEAKHSNQVDSEKLVSNEMQLEEPTPDTVLIVETAPEKVDDVQPLHSDEKYLPQEEVQEKINESVTTSEEYCDALEESKPDTVLIVETAPEKVDDVQPLISSEQYLPQEEVREEIYESVSTSEEFRDEAIRTTMDRRRTSRRKSNYGKKTDVAGVLEPPILLKLKKRTVTTLDATEETFQVNMPETEVELGENSHYSAISHTQTELDVENEASTTQDDQHRLIVDYGEHQLQEGFDAEQVEGDYSPHSEEARDFTILQPMPPFEYMTELAPPQHTDLTVESETPEPMQHMRHGKERSSTTVGHVTPSRPLRGTGTARRSRATFKSHRKRSSFDDQPSSSTKMARRK